MKKAKHVLFVCVGNSCRSQMAEGFANYYGKGKLLAFSAGTIPEGFVNSTAIQLMKEKQIDISHHRSKRIDEFNLMQFDAIISLCEASTDALCPATYLGVKEQWNIPDPTKLPIDEFRKIRDMIENRVKMLVTQLLNNQ